MRNKALRLIFILSVLGLLIFTTSGRGCPKRSRDKIGSSNEWAGIAAPSSLTATAFSYSEIRLSWSDNSNNEEGFEIERKMWSNGQYEQIATVEPDVTSYSDTTVVPFITYYYRVRAFNTIGDYSDYSNEVSVSTIPRWSAIVAGFGHSIACANDGTLWSWGLNDGYQLGLGDTYNRLSPVQIGTDTDWSTAAAGAVHTLAIKTNNTIWGWGLNGSGQLGFGDTTLDAEIPYQIGTDFDWSMVAAGFGHTIALKTNPAGGGTIWSWGNNDYGQLGMGDLVGRSSPTQIIIGSDTDWSMVVKSGTSHTIALKTNGTIWSWGANNNGQLGLGDSGFGKDRWTPTQIGTDSDWSTASADGQIIMYFFGHTVAIKNNNSLWGWGSNGNGELGLGDTIYRCTPSQIGSDLDWTKVTTAINFTIGLKINGTIWSWGLNSNGQLGLGSTEEGLRKTSPSLIGTDTDWYIIASGIIGHAFAIKTNSTIWAWGLNNYGQLGLGDTINRNIPTLIGE